MENKLNFSKKALAFLLAFSVLISALTVNFAVMAGSNSKSSADPFTEGIKGVVWNGETATGYAGGTGTKLDPYLIETPNQLAYMIKHDVIETTQGYESASMGKYYKLTANIYLNDVSDPDWKENSPNSWIIPSSNQRFGGNLDGDGYTVYGLYYSGTSSAALITYADIWNYDVSITNLRISEASINTTADCASALIGYVNGGNRKKLTISDCYVSGSVTVKTSTGYAGGLIALAADKNDTYTVKNCAVLATVSGENMTGGLCSYFGNGNNVNIKNTFAYPNLGSAIDTVEDSYTVSDLSSIKGEAAKTEMPKLDWENVWAVSDGYPVLQIAKPALEVWDGTIAKEYAGGTGTVDDPYLIANGSQLALMISEGDNSKDKYYEIAANIYLNDTTVPNWKENNPKQWYSYYTIGGKYFQGTLDGASHFIRGLYYNGTDDCVALIPAAKGNVTVSKIQIAESNIKSSNYALASVIGYVGGGNFNAQKCYIHENVTVECTDVTQNNAAGGIFGYGVGTFVIEDCAVLSTRTSVGVTDKVYTGAMVANTWSSTVNVKNSFAKGVFGKDPGTKSVENCYTTETDPVYNTDVCEPDKMKGIAAKDNMPYLDWKKTWIVTESGYPKFKPEETVESEIWDGSVAKKYAGGTGTAADPYLIAYGSQLAKMAMDTKSEGRYYKLANDIKLNDTSVSDWRTTAVQWIWNDNVFKGTFDGAGHTISGLYYNGDKSKVGLFCYTKNAVIKQVTLTDSYLYSTGFAVGSLVGDANSGTLNISDCVVDDTVSVESTYNDSNDKGAGGLVGYGGATITIDSCAFLGTVKAPGYAGALLGNCWVSPTVKNSFAVPAIKFCVKSQISGSNNYGTGADDENGVTRISASQMTGVNALINMPKLTGWAATEKYPARFYDGAVGAVWSGVTAVNYASGTGEKNDPYIIETAEQLVKMVKDSSSSGKYYKITSDIRLNDTSDANWKDNAKQWPWSDNMFSGNVNGEGHTISGLYYNGSDNKVGLFCYAKNAQIKRIVISDSYLYSTGFAVGSLVGDVNGGTVKIVECYATQTVYVESSYNRGGDKGAGGLVGYGGGAVIIDSSAFTGIVKAPGYAGALVGNCWTTVTVTNSFAVPEMKFCTKVKLTNDSSANYGTGTAEENSVTRVSADQMKGEAARTNMPSLNWEIYWKTTEGYPVCRFLSSDGTPGEVWTGAVAENYAGGDGSEENPYLIATGEQLIKMVQDNESAGKYYKLTHDIKLNDTSADDWKDSAKQWIWNSNVFKGNVDGDCHTVSGLYYNGDKSKIGLFCYTKDVQIKRIVLTDAYLYSKGFAVGSLVGDANGGTLKISECYVTETVSVESAYDNGPDKGAGGLVGYGAATITIDSCAFLGTVKAPGNAGAILGNCWSSSIVKNSFAVQPIKFCVKRDLAEGSANNYGTSADSENGVTRIEPEQMKGHSAKKNMPNLNWARSWKTTDDGYPVLNVGEFEGVPGQVWSGRLATGFAGGSGTIDDPYLISTPEQLAYLVNDLYASVGKYYKVTDDIYLNDVSKSNWTENKPNEWFSVSGARTGNFNGHIDGDGHVIYGLYINHEQTTSVVYTGLFPAISDGTVIEKLGISHAYMKVYTDMVGTESYVGGFAGYVFFNKSDSEYAEKGVIFPKISQCFGDKTVTLEGDFCGGIVAGAPRPANINDCYFVGKLIGERVGGIVGNSWTEYEGATVTHCYSATDDADLLGGGRAAVTSSSTPINYTENYANSEGLGNMVTQMSLLMMRGEAAHKNMSALDFEKIWYALPNGTPVLRIFGTTDKFSNTSEPKPIEISFVSNGGTECDSIFGNPEEKLKLPVPEKDGYTFGGWYVYRQLDFKFDIDYFPYFNQILYAKWIPNGVTQDFEEYPDTMYDTGKDYEYYLPGTVGYNADYVRNGTASMHRIGNDPSDSDFLVMYENLLTVGKQYKMTFWVTTDTTGTSADLSLVHENWPDVYDSDSGVEFIKNVTLQDGDWQKVEYTFIARSQWIAIRTSGNASVYFDDFMISAVSDKIYTVESTVNTDKNGGSSNTVNNGQSFEQESDSEDTENSSEQTTSVKKKPKKKKTQTNPDDSGILIPIIVISGISVITAGIVILIIVKRRKSKIQTKTL